MSNVNKPLVDQYPGDESTPEEVLAWAKKAKARIVRDIAEKHMLKQKNKKLRTQLVGQQLHSARVRSKIAMYENAFGSGLLGVIKFWFAKKGKNA